MDRSTDIEVLSATVDWLEEGSQVVLVTVARTWGSAPRRPGSLMVIHSDGRFVGSVSGGCVEDDLVQRVLRGEFEDQPPKVVSYGISTATTQRVGLPCGGQLELVVEYLDSAAPIKHVLDTLKARKRIARRVCLNTGEASLHPAENRDDFTFDEDNLVKVYGPSWRMLIIGAGELSRRVTQLALTLDYSVTICDSRPEYAEGWEVEGAGFSSQAPAEFIQHFLPDPYTVILALAHSPSLEDEALATALKTDAFYIGALGSHKNQAGRMIRLEKLGIEPEELARLHGPVGLDIGSHTPAEIAIAISAALIQSRNQQVKKLQHVEAQHG